MSALLIDPYSTARAIRQLAACLLLLTVALLVTAACQPSALGLALAGIGLRAVLVLRRHASAAQGRLSGLSGRQRAQPRVGGGVRPAQ